MSPGAVFFAADDDIGKEEEKNDDYITIFAIFRAIKVIIKIFYKC